MKTRYIFEKKIEKALNDNHLNELEVLVNSYSEYVQLHVNAISGGIPLADKEEE